MIDDGPRTPAGEAPAVGPDTDGPAGVGDAAPATNHHLRSPAGAPWTDSSRASAAPRWNATPCGLAEGGVDGLMSG